LRNEADRLEKGIRFGCGGLVGLLLGISMAIHYFSASVDEIVFMCLAAALVCGGLAAKYGDRFWDGLMNWLRWW